MATAQEFRDRMEADGITVRPNAPSFNDDAKALQSIRSWWDQADMKTREVLGALRDSNPAVTATALAELAGGKALDLLRDGIRAAELDQFFMAVDRALAGTGAPPQFLPTDVATVEPAEPSHTDRPVVRWAVQNLGGPSKAYNDRVEVMRLDGGVVQQKLVNQEALGGGGSRPSEVTLDPLQPGAYTITVYINEPDDRNAPQAPPPDTPEGGYMTATSLNQPLIVGGDTSGLPMAGYMDFSTRSGNVAYVLFEASTPADAEAVAVAAGKVAEGAKDFARIVTDEVAGRLRGAATALDGFRVDPAKVADAQALLATVEGVRDKIETAQRVVGLAVSRSQMANRDEDYDRTNPPPAVIEAAEAIETLATGLAALKGAGESEGTEAESTDADAGAGGEVPAAPPTPPTAVAPEPEPEPTPEPSEAVKTWATQSATSLVYGLTQVSSDGAYLGIVEWLREDLESELISRASDSEGAQAFSSEVTSRLGYIAGELRTERRINFFTQLMTRTNQGAVWLFVKEWPGFRAQDVGEDQQAPPTDTPPPPPDGDAGTGTATYYLLDAEGNRASSTSTAVYVQSSDGTFIPIDGGGDESEGAEGEGEGSDGEDTVTISGHSVPVVIDQSGNPYVTTIEFND